MLFFQHYHLKGRRWSLARYFLMYMVTKNTSGNNSLRHSNMTNPYDNTFPRLVPITIPIHQAQNNILMWWLVVVSLHPTQITFDPLFQYGPSGAFFPLIDKTNRQVTCPLRQQSIHPPNAIVVSIACLSLRLALTTLRCDVPSSHHFW